MESPKTSRMRIGPKVASNNFSHNHEKLMKSKYMMKYKSLSGKRNQLVYNEVQRSVL